MTKHRFIFEADYKGEDDRGTMRKWNFEDYLDRMTQDGAWGGCYEIMAMAKYLAVAILFIPEDDAMKPILFDGSDKINVKDPQEPIAVWYNGIHYDALVPEEGKLLPEGIMKLDFETSHLALRRGAVSQPVASLAYYLNTAQFPPQLPLPLWQLGPSNVSSSGRSKR